MQFTEDFLENYKNKKHYYFQATELPIVDWFSAIHNLDEVARNYPEDILELGNLGVVVHDIQSDKMFVNMEFAHYLMDVEQCAVSSHVYMSFTSQSKSFPPHSDDVDVYLYNALGSINFTVWDPDPITYTLVPGDMVYVPKGMQHQSVPLEPRVSISYGIEK
jgi:mannose-6-phosphate isomerase-like protein (cupin superfamily)